MSAVSQCKGAGFGGSELFPTTVWGDIYSARNHSQPALARLCERYRQPLFVYLQRRGLDYHAASDIVQGFFAHLLEREFLVGKEPGKGRFRAFLVQSIQNYLNDQHAHAAARKRGGGNSHVELTAEVSDQTPKGLGGSHLVPPDRAYEQAWAHAVLANALANWRVDQERRGDAALPAEALEKLMYADPDAPSYRQLSLLSGIPPGALKMRVYRLRLRLAHCIREEIRQTLANGETIEDELHHLILVLRSE